MTRTRALSFTSALALLLAACGGSDAPATPQGDAPSGPVSETSQAPDTQTDTAPETSDTASATATGPTETAGTTQAESGQPTPEEAEPAAENPFAALPAPYNTADFNRGKRTFRLCQSCHLIEEGAGNRVGPNLHGLFARKVGELDGFNYSSALVEADFDWTPEKLEEWLVDPRGFLPGNRMSFAGVRRPDDRTAVIAYIMAESGYGAGE